MRCHFITDEKTNQKVLIPGCYGSLHQEDLSNCTRYTLKDFKRDTKPVGDAERAIKNNASNDELSRHIVNLIDLFRDLEKQIKQIEK